MTILDPNEPDTVNILILLTIDAFYLFILLNTIDAFYCWQYFELRDYDIWQMYALFHKINPFISYPNKTIMFLYDDNIYWHKCLQRD